MEALNALRLADEVKTFPSIEMPTPILRAKSKVNPKSYDDDYNGKPPISFPGILKSKKSTLNTGRSGGNSEKLTFVGFQSAHLKLDVAGQSNAPPPPTNSLTQILNNTGTTQKGLTLVDMGGANVPNTQRSLGTKTLTRSDPTLDELRNYVVLMDKYSLHNFMIYEGRTLRETPEFQSFKRTYNYKWGAITSIIAQLEAFLTKYEIKLAIINGPKLFELSKLNIPLLSKMDIYSCISNIEQIQTLLDSGSEINKNHLNRAVTKIQSGIRMHLAIKRFKRLKLMISCAIVIQSYARLMVYNLRAKRLVRNDVTKSDERFYDNRTKMKEWWLDLQNLRANKPHENRSRLIIYIPSICAAEYTRLDFQQFHAVQNTHISVLYQLADPNVSIIYISPCQMSNYEIAYHEKFLSLMGISLLPKRLHFVTPEMIPILPPHLPLSQVLWCSSVALNKIRTLVKHHGKYVTFQSATLGWAEKRIANYLNVPLLSTDPVVSETITSRSFLKKVFMECCMNIPIGAHDIFTLEDLYVGLSRLISSNIGVGRWVIRLNYDYNNDSCVYVDVEKIPTIVQLRMQQNEMAGSTDNVTTWFSKHNQLTVRKQIIAALKKELAQKVRICRKDLYPSWEYYLRIMKQYGAVVEAEPIEKIGHVEGLCFIDPTTGAISGFKGVESLFDDNQQTQSYCYPQMITPQAALQGATEAVAKYLFVKYDVIGHIAVKFISFWDAFDQIPRLWATGVQFGMTPLFGALGTAGIASTSTSEMATNIHNVMPQSLVPSIPDGRYVIYVPIAFHDPLRSSHDDVFFKLCRMRGIAFDIQNKIGTLFFLLDTIVGGAISILCIGASRRKAFELAIHTMSFIAQQFGKDDTSGQRKCDNLTTILINTKKLLKNDKNCN